MTTDGITALGEAFLSASQLREATEDMSAQEINSLDMTTYAAIRRRAGLPEADPYETAFAPSGRPRPAPTQTAPPATEPGPPGVDPNSDAYFHAWRSQRQRGGEGVGLFDSVSSRSGEYTDAVRAQAGRTGWSTSNVVEPPRIGRAYVQQEQPPVYRSAADRFATPGNAFGN